MKFHILLISMLSTLFMFAPNASAQEGQIGDIINDIFNGHVPGQNDRHGETQNPYSRIDNIPVEIRYDAGAKGLPEQAVLVISAFAPPPPNVRRSAPLMIGETRLLLTGLAAPLHLVIAAPEAMTNTIDYARIEAKIIDINGNPIFKLNHSGEYRGQSAPVLKLTRIGFQMPERPYDPIIETIHGTVNLNTNAPIFRGSSLVVHLIEDGLAGGTSRMIIGQTRQSLDQKTGPFPFTIKNQTRSPASATPLAFEAWIEDWAGRKTHELSQPLPYNGSGRDYKIRLSTLGTPTPAPQPRPEPIQKPITPVITTPPPPSQDIPSEIIVRGVAKFSAHKGLPAASVLIATLERTDVVNGTIRTENLGQTRVSLDGLSGDVNFNIPTQNTLVASNLPTPKLNVRIEDTNGKLFFSNASGKRLQHGMNTVNLRAAPEY